MPWSTSYPDVPGAAPLTRALRDSVRAYLTTVRAGGNGPDEGECLEPAGSPGLQITFDFVIASGDVVGVRLTYRDAASDGEETRTFWYDGRTRTVVRPWALIAPSARGEAAAAIRRALAGRPGADPETASAALARDRRAEAVRDLSFDSRGGLHVRFGPGAVAPEHAGRQEVVIARAEAAGWLSATGHRAQEQAVRPERQLRLGGTPAREPGTGTGSPPAKAPGADVDCHEVKCIALTFDEGPGPHTAELLDHLERHSAHATFFVLGQRAAADPDLVRAEAAAGHEVGNHSWSHPQLPHLTSTAVARQLSRTDDATREATGETPALFRPPYGLVNDTVRREAGRPVVLWNRDTEDWKVRDAGKVAANVVGTARPGDIVLMHDIHATTVQAMPRILDELSRRGFHFVTVSHLLSGTTPEPGRSYLSNPDVADPR